MTKQQMIAAVEAHYSEVYGGENPDFCWDIELYQAFGLVPEDYEHPDEDKMEGSNYQLRKAGAVLLKAIYESGVAYDNPEVEAALAVFAARPPKELTWYTG